MSKQLPNHASAPTLATPLITQAQLRQYLELRAEIEQLEKKTAALRQDLLARLEAGAEVESGSLTALARVITQRPLSGEKLIPLLGKARVEELKAMVTPNVQRQLIVQQRPTVTPKAVAGTSPGWDGEFEE